MKCTCVKDMLRRSVTYAGSRDNQIYLTFSVLVFAGSDVYKRKENIRCRKNKVSP